MSETKTPKTPKTPKPKKPQSALQVPRFADAVANQLAAKLDDSKKHVIAAALLSFAELPTATQVALISEARVQYAGQFDTLHSAPLDSSKPIPAAA